MTFLQLEPPIPVYLVGEGNVLAYFIRDYGIDHDDYWTVVNSKGEFRTVSNKLIRAVNNETLGRIASRSIDTTAKPPYDDIS